MTTTTTTAAVGVLALAALLAARTQALSNGVDSYYGADRYTKLDRFLHDRMGLGGGGRSEPPALAADRGGPLSRTAAANAAVPDDDDDDGGGGDGGGGGAGDDDDDDDDDDDEDVDVEEQPSVVRVQPPVRLRHHNQLMLLQQQQENALFDHNVQNHEPTRTMSPISKMKLNLLGSRKAVEETMRSSHRISMLQGNNESGEAYKHQIRMAKEASCKIPRPRVVRVSDVYPSSNKKYMPTCTILHVCADDTGCCGSPTLKCGPKSTQSINLPFIVYTAPGLEDQQSSDHQSSHQKSLLFYNHTECECQSKMDEIMPRDTMSSSIEVPVDTPSAHSVDNNNYSCKCPTEYTVRYLANGSCSCDCFDKQRECIRYKKGNIYFNHKDRHCLASGQCLLPTCEYGVYSARTGRCPKKFESLYFKKKHYI